MRSLSGPTKSGSRGQRKPSRTPRGPRRTHTCSHRFTNDSTHFTEPWESDVIQRRSKVTPECVDCLKQNRGFVLNAPFIITQFQQSAVCLDAFLPDHLHLLGWRQIQPGGFCCTWAAQTNMFSCETVLDYLTLSELEKQVTGLQWHLLRSSGTRLILEGSQRSVLCCCLICSSSSILSRFLKVSVFISICRNLMLISAENSFKE